MAGTNKLGRGGEASLAFFQGFRNSHFVFLGTAGLRRRFIPERVVYMVHRSVASQRDPAVAAGGSAGPGWGLGHKPER